MPFDSTNRFTQILIMAEEERKRRRVRNEAERRKNAPYVPPPNPEDDKPITFERREYLHKLVKEALSGDN
jgi:hypothetical protein